MKGNFARSPHLTLTRSSATLPVQVNSIKAIVSVMMLREGWDVRNVTVVLGLRPFTAKAEILPEQVIGRGLRLMTHISPDRSTISFNSEELMALRGEQWFSSMWILQTAQTATILSAISQHAHLAAGDFPRHPMCNATCRQESTR